MTTVKLQQTLQGKKLEWSSADDMSGFVAWLPDGTETTTGFGGEFAGDFTVYKAKNGRKWIKIDHDGRKC